MRGGTTELTLAGGPRVRILLPPAASHVRTWFFGKRRGEPCGMPLALPKAAEPWSLTSLREKLIKIGAKVVSHGRYVTFQMAEVAVSRQMFAEILSLIARLRAPPALA
jgi:Transposase DDE domain group 1